MTHGIFEHDLVMENQAAMALLWAALAVVSYVMAAFLAVFTLRTTLWPLLFEAIVSFIIGCVFSWKAFQDWHRLG